jgi:hypothetical protein
MAPSQTAGPGAAPPRPPATPAGFQEARLGETPIRDLSLSLAGTPLAAVVEEVDRELVRAGITRVRPRYYLSTEWGVPFDTVAIAIPFYLARPDLTRLHAARTGFVEGASRSDLLRYLRHEVGHVLNYAYRLYEHEEWVRLFGPMTRAYAEDYRPEPFSRRFVRHLPGWYAQKHPDEDWAETFAVWMTPGADWRADYAGWPEALAKLEYADRTLRELAGRDPLVTATDLDADVGEIAASLDQYYVGYEAGALGGEELPPGLDGALRAIFEDLSASEEAAEAPRDAPAGPGDDPGAARRRPAAALIHRLAGELPAEVYRWTGHFPEHTRRLLAHLAGRADALGLAYPEERETPALVALTTFITALAMNHVLRGSYLP